MKKETKQKFNIIKARIAKAYGVDTVSEQFSATPTVEQRLNDKIVEQDNFLSRINVISVDEIEGQNILGYASGPASGRTDTSGDGERTPNNLLGLDTYDYKLYQTNSDVYMRYATMDAWAKFPDMADRYARYVQKRIANDRCLIGWYGESAAADTNLVTYPLMQDVNKGWLQYMREKRSANILTQGEKAPGEIRIGADGDFVNLDHAVAELVAGIPRYLRQDLIALIGDELVGLEKSALYQAIGAQPTEKNLATASLTKFGGMDWTTPNNFPGRGLVITSLDNLSIYMQSGTWRRHIKDKPEIDRVEDYNSRNEGYVVETPEKLVAVKFDNVTVPQSDGSWA